MNKFCLICASVACLSFFSSCKKSDPENHCLYVVYPDPYKILYADQEEDSLIFETFDSYEALSNQPDWITITAGASYVVNYDPRNFYSFKTLLSFSPNTTSKTRVGAVQVNSYEFSSAAIYYQYGFLNINHPDPTLNYSDAFGAYIPESATYELEIAADAESDSICFTVANTWTLEFSADADQTWLTLDKTSGEKNHNNVTIRLTQNSDEVNARTTSLLLKSGEVSNVINIKQLPAKDNNNE